MRWFRFYDDTLNDPKVLRLSDSSFRGWVALLCVASKSKGALPPMTDLGFLLRMKPPRIAALIADLVKAGLLDRVGDGYEPHNWAGRQYQSDGSAERVKRHREKRAAAGLQAQWTAPKALREAVYARDGRRCVYCGTGDRLSLDHLTPEIRGGTHDIGNLATACISCNGAKRDMNETEYREYVTLLKRSQRTEQITEQNQNSEARASGAAAPIDHRKRLFDEGLKTVARISGKGPDACRSFVGKCLSAAGDDAVIVLGLIEDAERNQTVDPCAWIVARLKPAGNPNGQTRSRIIQAADDLSRKIASFDGPAGQDFELRDAAGAATPRLLSHG